MFTVVTESRVYTEIYIYIYKKRLILECHLKVTIISFPVFCLLRWGMVILNMDKVSKFCMSKETMRADIADIADMAI